MPVVYESKPNNSQRSYQKKVVPSKLCKYVAQNFGSDYETQVVKIEDRAIAQIKKTGTLRFIFGLNKHLTIRVHKTETGTFVEIGIAAWLDKVASMGVGWIFTIGIPFLTAPFGIWSQYNDRKKAWAFIDHYMG